MYHFNCLSFTVYLSINETRISAILRAENELNEGFNAEQREKNKKTDNTAMGFNCYPEFI